MRLLAHHMPWGLPVDQKRLPPRTKCTGAHLPCGQNLWSLGVRRQGHYLYPPPTCTDNRPQKKRATCYAGRQANDTKKPFPMEIIGKTRDSVPTGGGGMGFASTSASVSCSFSSRNRKLLYASSDLICMGFLSSCEWPMTSIVTHLTLIILESTLKFTYICVCHAFHAHHDAIT